MRIAGFHKNSFVDYPKKICAVVFTLSCNMNCFYCHNKMLIDENDANAVIDTTSILEFLKGRKGFLDGVTISGGEPTLQDDIEEFIKDVKRLGYLVKLDTNGTNPMVIDKLISKELIDYIAMDIKAPFKKYHKVCGTNINIDSIKKSIDILREERIDYEFRTTMAPGLDLNDIIEISRAISGASLYVLQKYRGVGKVSGDLLLSGVLKHLSGRVNRIETRGIEICA
ncbi:UNVERIFIED_CONTAM: pyruvate formate lyase activating enzyme [Acetivibrio alkalicellulosi]